MNELIVFLAIGFVAYIFIPAGVMSRIFSKKSEKTAFTTSAVVKPKLIVPEDSMLRRHFLTHLRAEVENQILPQQVDLSLRHYYDASVAAELQKRLAG